MKETYLTFEVIWSDDDMLELRIEISNGNFSGSTTIYESREKLNSFANSLHNFPLKPEDEIEYKSGEMKEYSHFKFNLIQFNKTGQIKVSGILYENELELENGRTRSFVQTEILTEPVFIDEFKKEIYEIVRSEDGVAKLNGLKAY